MNITYRTKKLQRICTDSAVAKRALGRDIALKLYMRMAEIRAADTVEQLMQAQAGRCHALTGNRNGQFAMDLVHPYRLIFIEIVDYH